MLSITTLKKRVLPVFILLLSASCLYAQTEMDAIMMNKGQFCNGFMYTYSSWDHYWEGALKRNNQNLGTVSTQSVMYGANYGVKDNINVIATVPYVWTKASAGTLHGMKGIQDLSLFVKWRPLQRKMGNGKFSLFAIGGLSFPLSDYTPDFLPLSIGLRSTTLSAKVMADYQAGNLFATGSAAYVYRNNIKIDREAYYTTEMHYTNEVQMPDAANFHFRAGFRNHRFIAEAVLNNWTTLGGFDITRNNMPFPSNRMNATTAGVNFKYVIPPVPALSLVAGGNSTVAGRNMGQATSVYGAVFYALDLGRKSKSTSSSLKTN